jgi:hypothetical protein
VLEKEDGYAYLEQARLDEEENVVGWVRRIQLGYEESVLLVLLRDMMAEWEVGEAGARELVKKRREIKEYAELFFRENASRVKFIRDLDRLIDRVEELDFLERVESHEIPDEQKFRVKKIIKARVDNEGQRGIGKLQTTIIRACSWAYLVPMRTNPVFDCSTWSSTTGAPLTNMSGRSLQAARPRC